MRATDRDCAICEDGQYLQDGHEMVCEDCHHSPSNEAVPPSNYTDPWEAFWSAREEYSGFHGEDRKKCVGGFSGAY